MKITHTNQDKFLQWLIAACIYFVCSIAFYSDIGQDMGAGYFLPIFVPVVAALVLLPYATRVPIFSKGSLPNLLTGVIWAAIFSLLYTWTYGQSWYMSKICFDFIVGTSIFFLYSALEAALFSVLRPLAVACIMAFLNLVAVLIPLLQIIYYCMVWHCLTPASLMALYLTNWRESIDFIESNVGLFPTVAILLGLALFFFLCVRGHLAFKRRMEGDSTAGRMAVLALLVVCGIGSLAYYLPQTSIADLWNDVRSYVSQTQEYSIGHDERVTDLHIDATRTLAARAPGTVIFVIGESASRDYMQAFTPTYEFPNTPWQTAQRQDPNFFFFENAYSSWSQTVPVLQRALTEESQYNDKEFFEATSIIDVAKKAGYETWWFSNQGRYGQYDSAVTLVAKTADHAVWTDDSYNFSDKFDETLLPYLMQLDPTKNNFVVLHIMGSHIYYNNRYPSAYNVFQPPEGSDTNIMTSAASYANSILYTDHILQEVFNYAKKSLNLQAMVYFSDHGENLEISHNPDVFTFDMVRIPFWIYLSPAYQQAFPKRTEVLREHHLRYFTNDLLYDTMSGLLAAPSAHYDASQDFTSRSYRFNRGNLTTMLGSQPLTADPNGGPEE